MSTPIFDTSTIAGRIVAAFDSSSLSEDACRRFLLPVIRPAFCCPGCGVSYSPAEIERALSGKDVICGGCSRKAAPRAGTILDGVHAGFREVVLVAVMHHWGVPVAQISASAGISTDTVRRLMCRLRSAA